MQTMAAEEGRGLLGAEPPFVVRKRSDGSCSLEGQLPLSPRLQIGSQMRRDTTSNDAQPRTPESLSPRDQHSQSEREEGGVDSFNSSPHVTPEWERRDYKSPRTEPKTPREAGENDEQRNYMDHREDEDFKVQERNDNEEEHGDVESNFGDETERSGEKTEGSETFSSDDTDEDEDEDIHNSRRTRPRTPVRTRWGLGDTRMIRSSTEILARPNRGENQWTGNSPAPKKLC